MCRAWCLAALPVKHNIVVLGYCRALRVNALVVNVAMLIEAEFFSQPGPTVK